MAKKQVEKYALVSSDAEIPVVKKMGVPELHIMGIQQREQLVQSLQMGNFLCVGSVGYVASSASDLVKLMDFLYARGVVFQTGCEKALCFSQTAALPPAVRSVLAAVAGNETEFVRMIRSSRLKERDKEILINRICHEYLKFICIMFSNSNGIISQRNL